MHYWTDKFSSFDHSAIIHWVTCLVKNKLSSDGVLQTLCLTLAYGTEEDSDISKANGKYKHLSQLQISLNLLWYDVMTF